MCSDDVYYDNLGMHSRAVLFYSNVVTPMVHSSMASDSSEIEPTIIGPCSGRARLADARAWDLIYSLFYSIWISILRASSAHAFGLVFMIQTLEWCYAFQCRMLTQY